MKTKYEKISTYFKENIHIVIPLCISALFFDGLMCLVPIVQGNTIDSLEQNNYDKVVFNVILFISLVLFVQINRFFKRFLVRYFGNKMALRMRTISFANLLNRDISYFANNKAGDILNRNQTDIYDTTEGIRKMTTEFFDTIVLLLGYIITMIIMDSFITLVLSGILIVSVFISRLIRKQVYKSTKEYKEFLSLNKQLTLNNLNNELYYRGFGVSDAYYDEYLSSIKILKKKSTKMLVYQSSLEPLYQGVALLGVFFIAYFGGMKVMDNVYEIGTLSAYITTYLLVARKTARVGKVFNAYQGFKVSWQRCKSFLVDNEISKVEVTFSNDSLICKDLSYQYNPQSFKLPPVNFSCKIGEIIGVCGKIHSGKSTFLRALTGEYDTNGSAMLGSVDLKTVARSKEQYISYCAPNVSLFSDSIRNNIVLGREGDLEEAIKCSGLTNDLERLGGLEAMISHSTANISGGEQKRLQMARSLFNNSKLVLLDDPFQSVNVELANEMISSLKTYKDKIIIFVSNNINVLKNTNKIIMFNDDNVIVDSYQNLVKNHEFLSLMGVK